MSRGVRGPGQGSSAFLKRLRRQLPFLFLFLVSAYCGIQGGYIWSKAVVAQVLLRQAWQETDETHQVRPWSWADTHPVARLLVPEKDVDLVVLSGTTGRSLAFGPGHQWGSAAPGERGHSIIAAHRDTHFSFLADLAVGERLLIQTPARKTVSYEVQELQIVEKEDLAALGRSNTSEGQSLTLVTCYPFDAPLAGAQQRFLVHLALHQEQGNAQEKKTL